MGGAIKLGVLKPCRCSIVALMWGHGVNKGFSRNVIVPGKGKKTLAQGQGKTRRPPAEGWGAPPVSYRFIDLSSGKEGKTEKF